MVYTRILYNSIKEYTPSWMKTIPYSQVTKHYIGKKPQVVSKFNADPKVKKMWRFLQRNVQKNPVLWQVWIFANAFVIFHLIYDSWKGVYQYNNTHRTLDYAIAKEKEFQRKKEEESEE